MKLDDLKTCSFKKQQLANQKQSFQPFIKDIVLSIKQEQISFNQFMIILAKYNIKFYSPNQFKKVCKIFSNTIESIPKAIPFQYMQLHQIYREGKQDYYLIDISSKKVQLFVNDGVEIHKHEVDKCLKDFVVIMKKRYGKQINWFKVIGGMTVSVTIQIGTFQENLKQIMKNSKHVKCIERMTDAFQQPRQNYVSWNKFMSVTKRYIKEMLQSLRGRSEIRTLQNRGSYKRTANSIRQRCRTDSRQEVNGISKQQWNVDNSISSSEIKSKSNSYFYINKIKNNKDHLYQFNFRNQTQPSEKLNQFVVMKKCSLHHKFDFSKSFVDNQPIEFRKTSKTSVLNLHSIDSEPNKADTKRQTFFWNYLKNKKKRQL